MAITHFTGSGRSAVFAAALVAGISVQAMPAGADGDKVEDINSIVTSLTPRPGAGKSSRRVEEVNAILMGRKIKVPVDYDRAIDLTVYFRYDSARVTRRARRQLDNLGEALISPKLRPYRYLIAGHTDSVGSDGYNMRLSTRRALSVREYLVDKFGIRPERLIVTGWGERRLKDPDHPRSGINRRVEVALIADESDSGATSEKSSSGTGGKSARTGTAKPTDGKGCPPGTKPVDRSGTGTDSGDLSSILTGSEPRCVAIESE